MPGLLWSTRLNSGGGQFSSLPCFCVGEPFPFCSPLHLPAITRVVGLAVLRTARVTGQAQARGLVPASSTQTCWALLGFCGHKVFVVGKAESWWLGATYHCTRGVNLLAGQLPCCLQAWAIGQVTSLGKLQAASRSQVGHAECSRGSVGADEVSHPVLVGSNMRIGVQSRGNELVLS